MRNLKLPAQMSPCLRIFIASLLDDSTVSATHEIQRLPSAFVITAENDPLRYGDEAYAHKPMDAGIAVAAIRYDGKAVRVGRAVMETFGGDVFKAK